MSRILLVEDDPEIAELIRCNIDQLQAQCDLVHHTEGVGGLEAALSEEFDLLLLDIMLPGLHGTEICKRVRESGSRTPIMLLTARNSELDKVLGLEVGADDYVTKPFVVEELFARIRALLRRRDFQKSRGLAEQLRFAELEIDSLKREVRFKGERLELTPTEYDLLLYFATNAGKVFRREELLVAVWGATDAGNESIVNSHVNRLRKKLDEHDEQRFIRTVWGVGYRFSRLDELL